MEKTQAQTLIIAHLMAGNDFNFHKISAALSARDPVLFCQLAGLGVTEDWTHRTIAMLKNGEFVSAIREVRASRGMGLKEAKDVIDYFRQVPNAPGWYEMSGDSQTAFVSLRDTHGSSTL